MNPRNVAVQTLSKRPPSTTRPPLRNRMNSSIFRRLSQEAKNASVLSARSPFVVRPSRSESPSAFRPFQGPLPSSDEPRSGETPGAFLSELNDKDEKAVGTLGPRRPLKISWRRRWDLNPRRNKVPHLISSQAPSTARPLLHRDDDSNTGEASTPEARRTKSATYRPEPFDRFPPETPV